MKFIEMNEQLALQIVDLKNKIAKKVNILTKLETHDRTVKQGQNAYPLKTHQSRKRKVTPLNWSNSFFMVKESKKNATKTKTIG